MRIFQIVEQVKTNTLQFEERYKDILDDLSYLELCELYLKDGFYATHILKPILDFDWDNIGYAVWDYERLQKKWAEEQGFTYKNIKEVLWAQIEAFKPDVVYNLLPVSFTSEEINNIPTQPQKICWFAAPSKGKMDFSPYAVRLTNLPKDLAPEPGDQHVNKYFYPAIPTQMLDLAKNKERPIDVLFYGQYMCDFFSKRNALMDRLMEYKLQSNHNIRLHLLCQVVHKQVVNIPLLRRYITFKKRVFPSSLIWDHHDPPLFGAAAYEAISRSKIVINAAVDFSGKYKVNMRNFETTGCGAMLLTDKGIYPDGFVDGQHYVSYNQYDDLIEKMEHYLSHESERRQIAEQGHEMVRTIYSKENQWQDFLEICASIV